MYGLGEWKERVNWPINGLKIEVDHFTTLGITFSCDYDLALNYSWRKICDNIKTKICIMSSRYLTIYQRAIVIYSIISTIQGRMDDFFKRIPVKPSDAKKRKSIQDTKKNAKKAKNGKKK